jgi:hypothetical protein
LQPSARPLLLALGLWVQVMGRRAGKQHFNEKKTRDDIRDASKM